MKEAVYMERYTDYQEFIKDLTDWGDRITGRGGLEKELPNVKDGFWEMLYKARLGAEEGVFSPFLYLVLAAELDRYEALFLAAALYCGLTGTGQRFTYEYWKSFWKEEDVDFPGKELFFHGHGLLYEREFREDGEMSVRLLPRVFLFLGRELLEERQIPGMVWYYRRGECLPFLGKSIRKYRQMALCREKRKGRLLFYLHGRGGTGRKLNYAYLAKELQMSMAVIRCDEIQTEGHLREILVECLLHHAILVVELPEGEEDKALPALLYWMRGEESLFLTGGPDELFGSGLSGGGLDGWQYLPFDIDTQAVLGDREIYRELTGEYPWEREQDRQTFLNRYDFLPGKMRVILGLAMSYAFCDGGGCITEQNLRRAVLQSGGHSLRKYAKKVPCTYGMEDLILPESQKEKLRKVVNRVRNRKLVYEDWGFRERSAYGNGVSMIFAGSPGTGKTMAAQVIAGELGMELYRVELPAVVDKYIGETEKKLNRIFEEAAKSMAILFFDEADVLFGKRTEIKESNDRYSNMEIAFLLQKMEEYDGISILATNYLQNFDEAFRRRISEIVDFPVPDAGLREQMWRRMIPDRLPVSKEADFAFLAEQFAVTGSVIKNALLYGCFLAAESNKVLTMEHLLKGIGHELEKSGRKLSRKDYGEYYGMFEDG